MERTNRIERTRGMEKADRIKRIYRNMSLKKALTVTVLFSIILSVLFSIMLLFLTRPWYYMLTASDPQSIAGKIYDAVTFLLLGICSIAPVITGIYYFYKHKLDTPLKELTKGTREIAHDNLEFELHCDADDELGVLCRSFEKMREELEADKKQMWRMIEQRKELNAAFAHDLRTPLTVLRGYTDFLEEYIPSKEKSDEKLLSTSRLMAKYVERLEDYVETMHRIQKIEDTPIKMTTISRTEFMRMLKDNIRLAAEEYGRQFSIQENFPIEEITADVPMLFRVIENVTRNAFRYSRSRVYICIFLENDILSVEVTDDGAGFKEEDLKKAVNPFYTSSKSGTSHFGMGLAICKILCENHGGRILIENTDDMGARVRISIRLEK